MTAGPPFQPGEAFARRLDAEDPLAGYRERFALPHGPGGAPLIYFCGNSLGVMPKAARTLVEQELDDWAALAVDGHFKAAAPWYAYHEQLRDPAARLVGAQGREVVAMNGLTVNLHLMLVSFYRPTEARHKILIEDHSFSSDRYAMQSQLRWHGYDPADGLLVAQPRRGEATLRTEDLEALLDERGGEIALVFLEGVNYFTGQRFDLARLADAARRAGCAVGFDLAHAVGNVPLALHDSNADCAVWCSYKYLNAGPGAVGGCFVHERHLGDAGRPRFGGWWGVDPATRFEMHRVTDFAPAPSADGWQLSNPPILSMAPLRASLALFDEAGMDALRRKSLRLTGYLRYLVERAAGRRIEILTPAEPEAHGCQLSLRVRDRPRELFDALGRAGVVADFRQPDVIRVAPVPLYNTFGELWRFGEILAEAAGATAAAERQGRP